MAQMIESSLLGDARALGLAVLLGDKSEISEDLQENFSRSGLSHIIAISGMHIGIIMGLAFGVFILCGFWRVQASAATALFITAYIITIGAPASAVRAGVMGVLVLFALSAGRMYRVGSALLFACALLLAFNPLSIRYDIGFQLSFSALTGIILFYPVIDTYFARIYKRNRALQAVFAVVNMTISAQILLLPLIAHYFGIVSLVSIVSNLMVLWALPLVIVCAAVAFVVGAFWSSWWPWFPVWLIFRYTTEVSEALAGLPMAYLELEEVRLWAVAAYYMIVFALWYILRKGGD
jgi:competence protein ComEC